MRSTNDHRTPSAASHGGACYPSAQSPDVALPSISISPFRLDLTNQQLWHGSELLALRPKTFAVLRYLVVHAGRLVPKEELLYAVWPDTSGNAGLPKGCIRELRHVLGDDPQRPRFIETLGRQGHGESYH